MSIIGARTKALCAVIALVVFKNIKKKKSEFYAGEITILSSCPVYRLTRIKIEDSALVKNMLSFQNRQSQPVDLPEFANNLNVTVEDGSLISLFKMHLEVNLYNILFIIMIWYLYVSNMFTGTSSGRK